jgi:hypothetical protein
VPRIASSSRSGAGSGVGDRAVAAGPYRRSRRRTALAVGVGIVATCAAAGIASAGAGSNEPAAHRAGGLAFHEVDHGRKPGSGSADRARGRVLRSAAAAAQVLRDWGLDSAIRAVGTVDFERESLIVVLGASQPSTSYRLRVSRVLVRDRHAVVSATVRRPAGIDGQAITQPYALVALARGSLAHVDGRVTVHVRS